jgi:hypothetical protein
MKVIPGTPYYNTVDRNPPGGTAISRTLTPAELDQHNDMKYPGVVIPYWSNNVPMISQLHYNMCGDAALNMVLAFHGKFDSATNLNPQSTVADNPRCIFRGFTTNDITQRLNDANLRVVSVGPKNTNEELSALEIALRLKLYGPIVCSINAFGLPHFAVLTKVTEDHVFYHDPWQGPNQKKTIAEFNSQLLHGDDCMIGATAIKQIIQDAGIVAGKAQKNQSEHASTSCCYPTVFWITKIFNRKAGQKSFGKRPELLSPQSMSKSSSEDAEWVFNTNGLPESSGTSNMQRVNTTSTVSQLTHRNQYSRASLTSEKSAVFISEQNNGTQHMIGVEKNDLQDNSRIHG